MIAHAHAERSTEGCGLATNVHFDPLAGGFHVRCLLACQLEVGGEEMDGCVDCCSV